MPFVSSTMTGGQSHVSVASRSASSVDMDGMTLLSAAGSESGSRNVTMTRKRPTGLLQTRRLILLLPS